MNEILEYYGKLFVQELDDIYSGYKPEIRTLYDPVDYALEGGKKLRPVAVMLASDAFDGDLKQAAVAAASVEIFHNFTLVHDDVMDKSDTRRGRQTVFKKWDMNQAILSGDAMLLLAYKKLMKLGAIKTYEIFNMLTDNGLLVCEGQQLDMEFETKQQVDIQEYIKMIELKTSVLLGASLSIGAKIAGADDDNVERIYQFGKKLGLAFQIQDDYFDTFGDFKVFGKPIGNDIMQKKKTFLYLKALEKADARTRENLIKIYNSYEFEREIKISRVKDIFLQLEVDKDAQVEVQKFYEQAMEQWEKLNIKDKQKKQNLSDLAHYILKRKK